MAKKRPELSAWGIILIILGLIMYSLSNQQSKGMGLLIVMVGVIKIFWDFLKNG